MFACCGVGSLLCAPAADAAIIDIRSQVTLTHQSVVQLQDIATVSDINPEVVDQLNRIMLTPAPAAGRSLRITYDDIRNRLQAQGLSLVSHDIRGASVTEVRTAPAAPQITRSIPGSVPVKVRPASMTAAVTPKDHAKANEIVRTAFRRAFRTEPWEARGVVVKCSVDAADALALADLDPALIHFRTAALQVGASQQVEMDWQDPQTGPQHATVEVTLEQAALALALKVSLPAGAILRPEDLGWVTAKDEQPGITRIAEAVGMETKRSLPAGHRLAEGDLTAIPLIKSNDVVTVLVKRPGVTVSRRFKALSSGALGETVNLVAIDDPRLRVQATVTRYHEAVISDTPRIPGPPRIQDGTGSIEFLAPATSESGGTIR